MFEWTISSSLINTCMEYNHIQEKRFWIKASEKIS